MWYNKVLSYQKIIILPNLSISPSAYLNYKGALLPGKYTLTRFFTASSAFVNDANFTKAQPRCCPVLLSLIIYVSNISPNLEKKVVKSFSVLLYLSSIWKKNILKYFWNFKNNVIKQIVPWFRYLAHKQLHIYFSNIGSYYNLCLCKINTMSYLF